MHIHILEPYFGGSHRFFVEVLKSHSKHRITCDYLPPRFWKWRLSGAPFLMAANFKQMKSKPDLLFFSNTIDLASFVAMAGAEAAKLPKIIYFHENQIVYPLSENDTVDVHHGLINATSAMVADEVWFNSEFHRETFINGLDPFFNQFPDYIPPDLASIVGQKSKAMPVPVDPLPKDVKSKPVGSALRILWNHRWEYDKNPESFFEAMNMLNTEGVDFEVAVLGEDFNRIPPVFIKAQQKLGKRIVVFGYQDSRQEYASWVKSCDVVVSCARQEFFGISIAEAVLAGCYPLLPHRLVYPNFIPKDLHQKHLYSDQTKLVTMLREASRNLSEIRSNRNYNFYDDVTVSNVVPKYDKAFDELLSKHLG